MAHALALQHRSRSDLRRYCRDVLRLGRMKIAARDILPEDYSESVLVGRVWISTPHPGPRTMIVRDGGLYDLSKLAPTLSDLFALAEPAARAAGHTGERL